ncbi:MAG: hypothetical protein IR153_05815 [Flavobacterium sp.]|nr:hypothetical protein [Flavobacterium sp.]
MDIEKQRVELIEMLGVHFEQLYNLPPLGCRILSTLILDGCKAGLTFDDLVHQFKASKSSVSTNLNLLSKLGKITYYTLPNDRKKYYKPAAFSARLQNYSSMIANEQELVGQIMEYRQRTASCDAEYNSLENIKAYRAHLYDIEKLLTKTINEFKSIENQRQ